MLHSNCHQQMSRRVSAVEFDVTRINPSLTDRFRDLGYHNLGIVRRSSREHLGRDSLGVTWYAVICGYAQKSFVPR
jgi:hypothetical protein